MNKNKWLKILITINLMCTASTISSVFSANFVRNYWNRTNTIEMQQTNQVEILEAKRKPPRRKRPPKIITSLPD